MCEPFFVPEEFEAFAPKYARTTDPYIIGLRKRVVDKFRELHNVHLRVPMSRWDLHPHANRDNWTNWIIPKLEANGEWVDYVRFSWGKEGRLVQELAARAGFTEELYPVNGASRRFPFHYVSQVQIGINADYWWFNFYVDDLGWLEIENLIQKIKNPVHYSTCVNILGDLQKVGYSLRLWSSQDSDISDEARETPEEFLDEIRQYRAERRSFNVDIDKRFEPEADENCVDTMATLCREEFETLLPLYRFWSLVPGRNEFVPRL